MTDSHRPFLPRAVPVLRLAPGTLQIGGADGDPGLRVGPLPADSSRALAVLLRGLDGNRPTAAVVAEGVAAGLDRAVVADVLAALRACGRLVDVSSTDLLAAAHTPAARARTEVELPAALGDGRPGTWGRRSGSSVVVDGATRVGVPLASMLAASGVGRVHVRDRGTVGAADTVVGGLSAADEGRPRTLAAADAVRRAAPDVDLRPLPPGTAPDLLVLTRPWAAVDPLLAGLQSARVPHLVATVRGEVGVVGPLVVPGRTGCLRCAEVTRTDTAPEWPALASQLREPPTARTGPPVGPVTGGTGVSLATAVTALTQALGHLDGTAAPVALDATLELRSPDLLPRRRPWPAHPACACRAGAAAAEGRPGAGGREQGHWGA
ncbi:Molybdopterin or thiamine biosynthesis adenylyltransferase [Klenkia soli]|uniref:Molybdopterin or thiamine biosynthesis adenylyltransferase n=1 Tax=Klenkia soli TaxID=1052260 RepID=A0A1H0HFI9_9ACTN|nr:ThiF family adenylyltransferase [Klenkia soli]SDO17928.1 Molybdopterin or thiamine biosynthesis adenylyltransferase [Klenkia soli]